MVEHSRHRMLENSLRPALQPEHLRILDESAGHSVPAGSESHFRIQVVSQKFAGLSRIERHRLIYSLVADSLKTGLHALAIEAISPEEWRSKNTRTPASSPPCLGGSKAG